MLKRLRKTHTQLNIGFMITCTHKKYIHFTRKNNIKNIFCVIACLIVMLAAACVDGYYGQNCQHDCGAGCNDMCNKANGTCSCRVGWEPPRCEQGDCETRVNTHTHTKKSIKQTKLNKQTNMKGHMMFCMYNTINAVNVCTERHL